LYAAAMLTDALAPMAAHVGATRALETAVEFGCALLKRATAVFWDEARGVFCAHRHEADSLLCDRSLATAILHDQCPGGNVRASLEALEQEPPELGLSYPANAIWRLRALARGGRVSAVLRELRTRWAIMPSVRLNNTLGEFWDSIPDTDHQWSHCAAAPLVVAYTGIAGFNPLEPGFKRAELRPQLEDLTRFDLNAHTPLGALRFSARGGFGGRSISVEVPQGCTCELRASERENLPLEQLAAGRYRLPAGRSELSLTDT
jgi:hypothetical protein